MSDELARLKAEYEAAVKMLLRVRKGGASARLSEGVNAMANVINTGARYLPALEADNARLERERDAAVVMLKKARHDTFDIGQIADCPDWLGFSGNTPGEVLWREVVGELGKRGYAIYEAIEAMYPEGEPPTSEPPTGEEEA